MASMDGRMTMQGYGAAFARVYNLLWTGFARDLAPRLYDFYSRSALEQRERSLLDLCCGTGQLSLYFLERGFRVTGLDLSEAMLEHAQANAAAYTASGQARFVQGDAAAFRLDERFGFVVSSFDALNHLPDLNALRACFACVHAVTLAGGSFIFDLNTRSGLKRWNSISISETDEALVVNHGIYDGGEKAYARIHGFVRDEDGRYSRFEENVYNTAFELAAVQAALLDVGWRNVVCASGPDLSSPLTEPESAGRVFISATR